MSRRRSDLIVLVAGRPEVNAFLGVLQDWSALDLVSDFVFLDADAAASRGGSSCVWVSDGVATAGQLSAILARRSYTASARVVCVSQVTEEYSSIGPARGDQIRQEVQDALPSVDLTWIHAIAVTVPEQWPYVEGTELAWGGAHNVVLAPENAQSPSAGVAPLGSHERLHPVGLTHQAAALCSAVGLWVDEPRSFFRGESTVGGGQVAALRTFSRHLAAEGIRSEILGRLVDVRDGYPVPEDSGGRAQVVADEVNASAEMADAVMELHPEVRPSQRVAVVDIAPVRLGFFAAMRLFLRFFAGVVRGNPRAMLTTLEREASVRLAGAAQGAPFAGQEAAYTATVNGIRGIRADGTVARSDEFGTDIATLFAQVSDERGSIPPERHEYPAFWKDFVDGALTLLDGSQRKEGLAPRRIGDRVAVVNQPLVVVADPDAAYIMPDQARSLAGVHEIPPYDDDLAYRICGLLEQRIEQAPGQATALAATRDEIKLWADERSRTYTGAFGRKLAAYVRRVRQEVVDYAAELAGTHAHRSGSDEYNESQKELARTLLGFAACCAIAVVGVVILALVDTVGWGFALGALTIIGLGWLIVSTVIFRARQHELLKYFHERERAVKRSEALKQNLTEALIDLRRLQNIYRQYLSWARGLGAFVRAPLGRADAAKDADVVLGEGFCLNHRFGVIVAGPVVLDEVSRELQSELFKVGWLSAAWAQYLTDLPSFRDRHLVVADQELLFNDRPVSDISVLAQWSDAVVSADRTSSAGEIRDKLDEAFDSKEDGRLDRLFTTVRARSQDGDQDELGYGEFVAGLQEIVGGQNGGRRFSQSIFAAVPDSADPWMVNDVMVSGGRGQLRPLIVTELTRVFGPRDLAFGESWGRRASEGTSSPVTTPRPQV